MSCRMWPPRLVSNFATSTCSATPRPIRSETASTVASKSSSYSRAACLLFVRSGDLAIMLRRSKVKALKTFITVVTLFAFVTRTGGVFAQRPDDPAVFRSDVRLMVLHATVVDKNGHLITTLL